MVGADEPVPARRRPLVVPSLPVPAALAGSHALSVPIRWIALRALTLMLLVCGELAVVRDVTYYRRALHALFVGHAGLHGTLVEYPLPALVVLLPQFLLARMNAAAFVM